MLRRPLLAIVAALGAAVAATAAAQAPPTLPAATEAAPRPAPRAVSRPAMVAPALAPRAPGARLAKGQPLPPAELEAFVDGWMSEAMTRGHVPGAAVSIVQNGQVVLKKGYGFADLAAGGRVDPDRTLFRIASISKTFTWILVMRDVEAGRMRLDRPVSLYLPERLRLRADGMSRPVTVANLMAHAGGFEDRALGQLFERDPDRVRPLDLYLRQERPQRVYEPGAVSSYSNYGAALAGAAASFVSGKTFERRVEDEITVPLGMGHTTFREPRPDRRGLPAAMPAALRADLARGYRWTGAGFSPRPYEYAGQVAPAGAASSTAGDMARYMLMMLADGAGPTRAIYGPRAARAFRTPLIPMPRGLNGWAHGLMVYDLPGGLRGYGHDGDTISFHSRMVVIPDRSLGVFVTTSSDGGQDLRQRLAAAVLREFYGPQSSGPRAGDPALSQERDRYAGYFLGTRRAHSGLEGFVTSIASTVKVSVTPDGRLITSDLDELRAWTPDGDPAAGRFVRADGDGRLAFGFTGVRATSLYDGEHGGVAVRTSFWRRGDVLAVMAGLAFLASVATLAGLAARSRRDARENPTQGRAALVQNIQACLWLTAFILAGMFLARSGDRARVLFDWPSLPLIVASACALVAAALTLTTIAALPAVWRGGRRVDSWPPLRRAFFTLTVFVYAAFSILLALWGALAPWSG